MNLSTCPEEEGGGEGKPVLTKVDGGQMHDGEAVTWQGKEL